jgi:hypothetical protein
MNVYQVIAIVSATLALGAGLWDARRLRTTQRYSGLALAISAGGPILSLGLYLLVTNLALKEVVSLVLVALGAALGFYAASRATLAHANTAGEIRLVGASWLPIPAAASVAALQVYSAIGSLPGLIVALSALEISVAFGVAAALTLMYRRAALESRQAVPGGPNAPTAPPASPVGGPYG